MAQTVKNLLAMQDIQVQSLGWEDPLEKGITTHSSILAWRIPWTEQPDRLHTPWGRKELDTFTTGVQYNDSQLLKVLLPL